jgi:hypothetical protein
MPKLRNPNPNTLNPKVQCAQRAQRRPPRLRPASWSLQARIQGRSEDCLKLCHTYFLHMLKSVMSYSKQVVLRSYGQSWGSLWQGSGRVCLSVWYDGRVGRWRHEISQARFGEDSGSCMVKETSLAASRSYRSVGLTNLVYHNK